MYGQLPIAWKSAKDLIYDILSIFLILQTIFVEKSWSFKSKNKSYIKKP